MLQLSKEMGLKLFTISGVGTFGMIEILFDQRPTLFQKHAIEAIRAWSFIHRNKLNDVVYLLFSNRAIRLSMSTFKDIKE